ncbi:MULTISPECIES: secondary thiamine-phosphate synthase enzyme YjbQ [Bacillus]|uniref:secondary thiamine-phosphate synthase enzyme YjbQ n=1 Tax=Bacillus TaxID=1386 RepID=UPI0013EBB2AD|nr:MULTISPECIES: secondary thiamine-phosphate synthase enzyme YjbQ [Bacillus]MCK6205322.1 secondary thiamine-phosphate synthase enzyme YjbQ [Bacillus infantis]MCP1158505.1 secondary thiamine-phosphate synthase enzyme YjbQ [Bacillus infantis]MDT0158903.1 secondary thiamine-phosphate synthase enzyme YjbQ [Bacillus sp. AG4(2022)]
MLKKYSITTSMRDELAEITDTVREFASDQELTEGAILIYCPHTTAGLTINENADPDVKIDMINRLDETFPWNHLKDRHEEGNTAAHLKASCMGASQHVIVTGGSLLLGVWQGIYFCEFDGPRERTFYLKAIHNRAKE